jgi:hypothetical protein
MPDTNRLLATPVRRDLTVAEAAAFMQGIEWAVEVMTDATCGSGADGFT